MATPARSPRRSAGILLHRGDGPAREVLLVHPGGPFWARRDAGVWSIPKGEYELGDDPLAAARREFAEELGAPPQAEGEPLDLGEIRQRAGKVVRAFALTGDFDPAEVVSNTCEIEWPPRSGRTLEIPEVDRAEWCALSRAREKLIPAQVELLDRLATRLGAQEPAP